MLTCAACLLPANGELSNQMESYSFDIRASSKKIIYTADLAGARDLGKFADRADLLIVDGMHLDLATLPALAARKQIARVMLTHLPESFRLATVSVVSSRMASSTSIRLEKD